MKPCRPTAGAVRGPDHTDQNPKRAVLSSLFSVTYVLWCGRVSVCAHARLAYVSSRSYGYPLRSAATVVPAVYREKREKGFSPRRLPSRTLPASPPGRSLERLAARVAARLGGHHASPHADRHQPRPRHEGEAAAEKNRHNQPYSCSGRNMLSQLWPAARAGGGRGCKRFRYILRRQHTHTSHTHVLSLHAHTHTRTHTCSLAR